MHQGRHYALLCQRLQGVIVPKSYGYWPKVSLREIMPQKQDDLYGTKGLSVWV